MPGLMQAIKFHAENKLNVENVVAARIGMGLKEFTQPSGFTRSILILWRPDKAGYRLIETSKNPKLQHGKLRLHQEYKDWQHLRLLQIFTEPDLMSVSEETDYQQAINEGQQVEVDSSLGDANRLSTIPEENSQDVSIDDGDAPTNLLALAHYLAHEEPELQSLLQETKGNHDELVLVEPTNDVGSYS